MEDGAHATIPHAVASFVELRCSSLSIALGWEISMAVMPKLPMTRAHVAASFYIGVKFEDIEYPTIRQVIRRAGLVGQAACKQLRVERDVLLDGLEFHIPHQTRAKRVLESLHEWIAPHLLHQWLILALVSGTYGVCDAAQWVAHLRDALVARTRIAPILQVASLYLWPRPHGERYLGDEMRRALSPARLKDEARRAKRARSDGTVGPW